MLINQNNCNIDNVVKAMANSSENVKAGIETVNGAHASFVAIAELVNKTTERIQKTFANFELMNQYSNQVVDSINKIKSISDTTAGEAQTVSASTEEQSASMEEIAASSQALAKLAEGLHNAVRQFKI
ncbi:Methyl-accepting chemotaxis protein McpB [Sporomusa carbonis]